ncbi:hypothetical protein [Ilumatobacter coccineus]|uniref:Uncharacterized protein n=1 Tax=Ilumatobacter coccineus (strain NBRC 103263 / KCTC 29153 / YM16-304) TaxID=1313172 RepID=A0A6C7EBB1_ILUCY|nr:hypothetical protein [Ilumatobacter coccineus]BAN03761.1 hypothetical protein YM304_34470 [Ilumatobacter coccineus YM16-304]
MSAIDIIESVRPDVDPMPLVERRMIREQLFGVGHGDVSRNISARSASGAVVSTAPRGTRALAAPRGRSSGSMAKAGAGLLLFAALGAAGWAFVNRGSDDTETRSSTTTPATTEVTTTVASTTTVAPIERTGVTDDFPIVLPVNALAVDTVNIGAPAPGSSAVIFEAPDGTNVWLAEVDGDVGNTDGLDVQIIGALGVGTASDFVEGDPPSYQLQVPCGFVLLNDAPGQPLFRPEITGLLEATSIDGLATIDTTLPTGWSIIDIGTSVNTFTAQFQVPRGDTTAPVLLAQAPGGSLAQLAFGGRQFQATTFLGDTAFIDSAPLSPNLTSVFWRDGNTVFNVRSDQLGFSELEEFILSLEAVEITDWETRFDQVEPPAPPLESTCTPQPTFGTTLNP